MNILRCAYCNSPFNIKLNNKGFGVAQCKKHAYPIIEGIFYLIKNRRSSKSVELINSKKYFAAKIALVNLPRRLSFPSVALLSLPITLRFKTFIKIINIFGYNKSWSEYLINRGSRNSFQLNKFVSQKLLKKRGKTVDLGCGVGQLIPQITSQIGPTNVYSLDSSFLNLLIARKYFATNGETLICYNLENQFPFKSGSVTNLYATDTFHYIKNKGQFLVESARVIQKGGMLFLLQIVNSQKIVFGNILGIEPKKLLNMLNKHGFKNINLKSNKNLIKLLGTKKGDRKKQAVDKILNLDEYSVFAQKN